MKTARHIDHEDLPHPSAATVLRHVDDLRLRRCGFSIHSRPRDGEPVWRDRQGKLWSESEAVALVDRAL